MQYSGLPGEKSYWLYNLSNSKQGDRNKPHSKERIISMQELTGDIFDWLICHSLVGASYDEPLLCNHFQAFRLIVRNVRTITSLSLPKWLWWKRDPNARGYIMSNPLSCPFSPNMKKRSSCKEQLLMLCQANCWMDAYSKSLCPHIHTFTSEIRPCCPVRQCADLDLHTNATWQDVTSKTPGYKSP